MDRISNNLVENLVVKIINAEGVERSREIILNLLLIGDISNACMENKVQCLDEATLRVILTLEYGAPQEFLFLRAGS